MSAFILNDVRKGFYLDSVALMRLSREIAAMPGVADAALMMATPANRAILKNAGLLEDGAGAQGNDLMIAVRADNETAARKALDEAVQALERPKVASGGEAAWHPRTIAGAIKAMPDANLALISVPGVYAAAEARKALHRGLNVMIFSDNVSLEDEVSLKREARQLGLLVMGPDCGTAVIGGTPLAFANELVPGGIGIIGASGTGMQEVSCLISEGGGGISHAIGVGGRDLKKEVGGITTLMAIDLLDADPGTDRIVLVSKPPHPDVAATITARIGESEKDYTVCFIGADGLDLPPNASVARTLRRAAELALGDRPVAPDWDAVAVATGLRARPAARQRIEGLYSGGTLCAEAQVILSDAGRMVASNQPIPGIATLRTDGDDAPDRICDLGADEYTLGRPHPMIDPAVRDDALRSAMADPRVGVILVDLVIGHGAHSDPAGHLAAVVAEHRGEAPTIIGAVTGTERDPQQKSTQTARLREGGILVAPSNAQACELALALTPSTS